ncbi:hypothetical protein SERLA73DRAFT_81576, partial [Serpula lacrymans var. lacrymans S7.3]
TNATDTLLVANRQWRVLRIATSVAIRLRQAPATLRIPLSSPNLRPTMPIHLLWSLNQLGMQVFVPFIPLILIALSNLMLTLIGMQT